MGVIIGSTIFYDSFRFPSYGNGSRGGMDRSIGVKRFSVFLGGSWGIGPEMGRMLVFMNKVGKYDRAMMLEAPVNVERTEESRIWRAGGDVIRSTQSLFHHTGRFTTPGCG
jgi:hypothetical protein